MEGAFFTGAWIQMIRFPLFGELRANREQGCKLQNHEDQGEGMERACQITEQSIG